MILSMLLAFRMCLFATAFAADNSNRGSVAQDANGFVFDNLVDRSCGQMYKSASSRHAGLDDTTFGKPSSLKVLGPNAPSFISRVPQPVKAGEPSWFPGVRLMQNMPSGKLPRQDSKRQSRQSGLVSRILNKLRPEMQRFQQRASITKPKEPSKVKVAIKGIASKPRIRKTISGHYRPAVRASVAVEPSAPPNVARRSAVLTAPIVAAASFLHFSVENPVVPDCTGLKARGLRVAITGASSGIGLEAARLLYMCGGHVIVLNRSPARVQASIDAITGGSRSMSEEAGTLQGIVCDLSSLSSVNAAADQLANAFDPIDVLCLNAGVQFTGEQKPRITEDGFEQTLQTNHLGHVLLAERLIPTLARAKRQRLARGDESPSRIVVTASELHNPLSRNGGIGGPRPGLGTLNGLLRTDKPGVGMMDGSAFDAFKMYKDTKLCNILFTNELSRQLSRAGVRSSDITVNAFNPGFITESGFFRNQDREVMKLADFAMHEMLHVTESVTGGGVLLANMAANPICFTGNGRYWSKELAANADDRQFTTIPTSAESQDQQKAAQLYEVSARLVGVDAGAQVRSAAMALRHLHPNLVELPIEPVNEYRTKRVRQRYGPRRRVM